MGRGAISIRDAALFGAVVSVWGLNYLFVRVGLAFEPPLWLAFLRAGTGASVVLAALAFGPRRVRFERRDVFDAVLIGVPNTAVFFGLWFVAAPAIPPGQTAVLVYTFPLWVTLLSGPWLGEWPTRSQLGAVGLGFGGVVLVSQPWATGSSALPLVPVAELLFAAIAWGLGTVAFKRRFHGEAVAVANGWQLAGGALALLVAGVAFGPRTPVAAGWGLVGVVAWLGLLGTGLAYSIWFRLLDRWPAVTVTGFTFLVPLVALAASSLVLGERLVPAQLVGVAAVFVAIYLNATGAAKS